MDRIEGNSFQAAGRSEELCVAERGVVARGGVCLGERRPEWVSKWVQSLAQQCLKATRENSVQTHAEGALCNVCGAEMLGPTALHWQRSPIADDAET